MIAKPKICARCSRTAATAFTGRPSADARRGEPRGAAAGRATTPGAGRASEGQALLRERRLVLTVQAAALPSGRLGAERRSDPGLDGGIRRGLRNSLRGIAGVPGLFVLDAVLIPATIADAVRQLDAAALDADDPPGYVEGMMDGTTF